MAPETNPSAGTAAAAAAVPHFQVDEAYEYCAPKYFDFVSDETEDDVRAAERWFEASGSHAPTSFAPRIRESRAEIKTVSLCDLADADEPAPKKEAMEEEAAGGGTDPAGDVDRNAQEKKRSSFGFVPEANHGGSSANAGCPQHEESAAASADAMWESPPEAKEEKESAAQMVKKFDSGTRESGTKHNRSFSHEPELQTSHRVRAIRMKSSAQLEEEMLAKIPKFRARPFNKKIAEAPSFPPLPRKAPQLPEFNEFHLKMMERATRHADTYSDTSSVGTTRISYLQQSQATKPLKLTGPKPPQLKTALRARPARVKTSQELELEELEKAPKFKAKPLNRKILESKGHIGVFAHPKPQATAPKEFHFSTDDRLGPPAVVDLFDKLSLHSECSSYHEKRDVPRLKIPNPFNLHTDERGHEKERQLAALLLQQKLEEETARSFKANPYPYTTDYPVVPPKPEPKPCTRPEGFQLESLVRHELEQQRLMEESLRMEREEAQRRMVKAQPILKKDPMPLPEKERKPLTEVQQFELHVDERAVQRSEFDTMVKEKEITYKRLREKNEFAQKIEEEKALKQLRTLVPQARPLPMFDRPFRPQRSTKQVIKPKSPQLHVDERGARRHAFMR